MADSNAKALRDLAKAHLAAVLTRLPSDRMGRFVMFVMRHGMGPATEEGMKRNGALWGPSVELRQIAGASSRRLRRRARLRLTDEART